MEFCWFLCSVKFVVRSLCRFLGCGVCLWLQQSQGNHAFFEKLAHFLAFVVKVGVDTAEASQPEELREWEGLFVDQVCCHGNRYDVISALKVLPNNRVAKISIVCLHYEVSFLGVFRCFTNSIATKKPFRASLNWA